MGLSSIFLILKRAVLLRVHDETTFVIVCRLSDLIAPDFMASSFSLLLTCAPTPFFRSLTPTTYFFY